MSSKQGKNANQITGLLSPTRWSGTVIFNISYTEKVYHIKLSLDFNEHSKRRLLKSDLKYESRPVVRIARQSYGSIKYSKNRIYLNYLYTIGKL